MRRSATCELEDGSPAPGIAGSGATAGVPLGQGWADIAVGWEDWLRNGQIQKTVGVAD